MAEGGPPSSSSADAFMADLLETVDAAGSSSPVDAACRPHQGTRLFGSSTKFSSGASSQQAAHGGQRGTASALSKRSPGQTLASIQRAAFAKPNQTAQVASSTSRLDPSSQLPAPRRAADAKVGPYRPAQDSVLHRSPFGKSRSVEIGSGRLPRQPAPATTRSDFFDDDDDDDDGAWMLGVDETDLVDTKTSKTKSESCIVPNLISGVDGTSAQTRHQSATSSSNSLIKRASRTQSKLWADRAKEHKVSNQAHRSYIRCRVLSVRESTYEHQLANSSRTLQRPQQILICIERPRRGAQYRDDPPRDGEEVATWDGRSQVRKRRIILREEWTATRVAPGDYVHCVGNWDEEELEEDDEVEVQMAEDKEQREREARDQDAERRPFSLHAWGVKKEEEVEDKLPPSSFDSSTSLFADLDEDQLLNPAPPSKPTILTMYLLSSSPVSDSRHADNLLILHPDILVTATAVCDVPTCIRKPLIKQRINGTGAVDKMSEAVVMGNMLHEVLQACLTGTSLEPDEHDAALVPEYDSQESLLPFADMPFPMVWYGPGRTNFSLAFVLKQIKMQVLRNLDGLLCCHMETSSGEEKLRELCKPFGDFARKYLEDTMVAEHAQNVGGQIHGLFRGRDGLLDMAGMFKDDATVVDSRTTVPTLARVTHVFDVEEEIWSPMYGLKGKMDVSVEVELQETHTGTPAWRGGNHFQPGQHQAQERPQPQTSFYRRTQSASAAGISPHASTKTRTASIMPLEIKTGKSVDALEHRAQTMLYTLMMSDRYGTDVNSGMLYYTRSGDMHRVRRTRNEVRGLIVGRNELAYWIRCNSTSKLDHDEGNPPAGIEDTYRHGTPGPVESETLLPPTIDNDRECNRCFAQSGCMIYRRAVDRIVEDPDNPSEIAGLYERVTGHLTPEQAAFYAKWEHLLSLEESDMIRFKRELWTLTAAAREEMGRCFANMVIDPRHPDAQPSPGSSSMHSHTYRFVREPLPGSPGQSLLGGTMSPGDPCVVSIEPNTFSVAQGYIIDVTSKSVLVGLDHHLDAILERAAVEQGQPLTTNSLDITFRIDRDEYSDGMAKIRFALSRFFFSNFERDQRHRELIVDLAVPRFQPEGSVLRANEMPPHLNEDQQNAMRKVCAAEDYALILGMPGTGKTTTIAQLIRLLVGRGHTILLASYTHSAVDTILRKLLNLEGVKMLRLGNVDRVHADLQHCTLPRTSTVEELDDVINAPNVIGTTCLSTGHATFARRKFDYCIIDEASQITLPSTLGSLRFADKFVLVGDHYQLPPLVRNSAARTGGLDVSLFKRLHEAHPSATVYLTRQYRMNESIMLISNHLIYNGQLKCGNEQVAQQVLPLSRKALALEAIHEVPASSTSKAHCIYGGPDRINGCWLAALLDEKCKAVFVDTDDVPGHESRRGRMIQNDVEAGIIQQLARGLVLAGVAPKDIAVITPYRQQLKLLQQLLLTPRSASQEQTRMASRRTAAQIKREAGAMGGGAGCADQIEILTADRSQGRDKPVVLISLVRSNDMGTRGIGELLNDWRRINVALTRAQSKVVIIGSSKTLSAAPLLVDFFGLMKEQGWIYKLPPHALDMHPCAAVDPTSPHGLSSSPKQRRQPVQSPSASGPKLSPSCAAAADGFVLAGAPTKREPGASTVLEELQPLSQSSVHSNKSDGSSRRGRLVKTKTEASLSDDDSDIEPVDFRPGPTQALPGDVGTLGKRKERSRELTGPPEPDQNALGRHPSASRSGRLGSSTKFSSSRPRSSGSGPGRAAAVGEALLKSRPIIRDVVLASQED